MKKHTRIFCGLLTALAAVALLFACSTGSGGGDEGTISKPYVVDAREVADVSFNMHSVPDGKTFIMGEHVPTPTQTVTLTRNFWMGETEVTQGLWEAVWGTTWPGNPPYIPSSRYGLGSNKPAYYVNWYDAVAFCNLLTVADSSITDAEQVYFSDSGCNTAYTKENAASSATVYVDWTKKGYRLPTEAEWEYAERYIDGVKWNYGDHVSGDTEYSCYDPGSGTRSGSPLGSDERISEYAWWNGNNGNHGTSEYGTKVVGQKKPNALGLRDMSGNVHEWCYDWLAEYSGGSKVDPVGPVTGTQRIYRGGDWDNTAGFLVPVNRHSNNPRTRSNQFGFRLCRTAD